ARAVSVDMGGTSTDVCLLRDGVPVTARDRRLAGHVVRLPAVAVESVGAGGGSIAWVDDVGALRVGPRSAGAVPGPAAYGRGGVEATVTDADVVLGLAGGVGGGLELDRGLAHEALAKLGSLIGRSSFATASRTTRSRWRSTARPRPPGCARRSRSGTAASSGMQRTRAWKSPRRGRASGSTKAGRGPPPRTRRLETPSSARRPSA